MKVFIAADHAGFALKNELVDYARALGHEVEDVGAHALNSDDDYPDFVTPCALRVAENPKACGVIIGRSGQGEAMCANRVSGARAAIFYSPPLEIIQLAREHNNANILSLGAQFVSLEEAKNAVKQFLETPFSDAPRHARRLSKF